MADLHVAFYNIGAFICAVFVLHYGADLFVDHTVIVARRLGLNQTLVALLTAGAEWEELAVVIAALAQHKPSLALGNVIGSCISNILGAFSLGLLFRPFSKFDQSARVYSLVQLAITAAVVTSLATAGPAKMGKIGGSILISSFVIYILSVAWSIYRGIVKLPEGDSDEESSVTAPLLSDTPSEGSGHGDVSVTTPLLAHSPPMATSGSPTEGGARRLGYHVTQIMIGFLSLSLSGYVLSHAASSLSSSLGVSETVMGLTILSFATTLPEKLVALVSGSRGHSGILVAVTAGSNIFLLTLCIGVALLGTGERQLPREELKTGELAILSASACAFAVVVWLGTTRWIGALMFAGYLTFLVLEFTIWRR